MRKYQDYYKQFLSVANAVINSKNPLGQSMVNLPVNEAKMAMNIADAVKNTAMDVGNYTLDTGETWVNGLAAIPQAMQGVQPKDYKDVVKITPSESSTRGQELVNSFIFSNPQTGITLPQGYGEMTKTYAKEGLNALKQGITDVGRVFNPNYGLAIENAVMNNADDVVKNTSTYYDDAGTAVSNAIATNTDDAEKALIEKFKTKGLSSLTPEEKKKIMEMPSERITEIANGFKPGERLAGDRQIKAGTKSYDDVYKNSVGYGGSKVDDVQAGLNDTGKLPTTKDPYQYVKQRLPEIKSFDAKTGTFTTKDGNTIRVGIREDGQIYDIEAGKKGTGLGSRVVSALKEWSMKDYKGLSLDKNYNRKFWEKQGFKSNNPLDPNAEYGSYRYKPWEDIADLKKTTESLNSRVAKQSFYDTKTMPTSEVLKYTQSRGGKSYGDVMSSIEKQGFDKNQPIVINKFSDGTAVIVDGNGRALAARDLGIKDVPVIVKESGLNPKDFPQRKPFRVAQESLPNQSFYDTKFYRGEPTGYGKPFGSYIKTDKYGVPRTLGGNYGIPTSTDVDYVSKRFAGEKGTVMQYVPKREIKVLSDPDEIMKLSGVKNVQDFFHKSGGTPAMEAGAWYRKAKEAGYDAVDLSKIENIWLNTKPTGGVIRLSKTPENEVRILNPDAFDVKPHVAQESIGDTAKAAGLFGISLPFLSKNKIQIPVPEKDSLLMKDRTSAIKIGDKEREFLQWVREKRPAADNQSDAELLKIYNKYGDSIYDESLNDAPKRILDKRRGVLGAFADKTAVKAAEITPTPTYTPEPTISPGASEFEKVAAPILKKYGIPLSVGIGMFQAEGGKIGKNNPYNINAVDSNPDLASDYETLAMGIEEFAKLIALDPRYDKAWQSRNNPKKMLEEIFNAGYAGDPTSWKQRSIKEGGAGMYYDTYPSFVMDTPAFKHYNKN